MWKSLGIIKPTMVHFYGMTNQTAYCHAVGVFWRRCATGHAQMTAFFPDVAATGGTTGAGYKLVATWANNDRSGEQLRFGLASQPGVCALIPPEAFAPGAVTNLLGRDDPGAVEYWIEHLKNAPCGEWNTPSLR